MFSHISSFHSHWCNWEGESHFLKEDGELASIWTITIGQISVILFKDMGKIWFRGIHLRKQNTTLKLNKRVTRNNDKKGWYFVIESTFVVTSINMFDYNTIMTILRRHMILPIGGLFDNSLIKPSTPSFNECLVSVFIEKEIGTIHWNFAS